MMSNEVTFRRARPEDVNELGKLSDIVFRPTLVPGTGMPKEFSLTFSPANAKNLYLASVDDHLVSLVANKPGRLMVNGTGVSALSMGSVCTLAEYRQHHYVSKLIEQVVADFQANTSVLLVSGGLSIYRRIGCVDFGKRVELTVHREKRENCSATSMQIVPFSSEFSGIASLNELYNSERYHYEREDQDFLELVQSFDVPLFRLLRVPPRIFTAYDGNRITAYVVASFSWTDGHAHVDVSEWAGARSVMPYIANYILRWFEAETITFRVHQTDKDMLAAFDREGVVTTETTNQGTIRILNPDLLVEELQPLIEHHFGASLRLQQVEREVWKVDWSAKGSTLPETLQHATLNGLAALSAWFFGPEGLQIPLPHTDDLNFV